ncbi:MAG TPA: peptide chain release factor N(5)-glutamine methyltransferase [bacterium]|nr:peptide chain release factor N(5)-glutamine methyltransferase [bacterium]
MAENASIQGWTLLRMIQWSSDYLATRGFENSRLLSERLLAHVLELRRVDLYLQFDRPLTPAELAHYKQLFLRLVAHEPLQYLLGETEFMSLPFAVGPGVLIPRPETELLVEKALERARAVAAREGMVRIIDLGTGTGCIAVSLAKNVPEASLVAVDLSAAALEWAERNSAAHGVSSRVELVEHDFRNSPLSAWRGGFDLAVSNPPYIRSGDWAGLAAEIRDHEPREALLGGEDGLDAYRNLAQILPMLLKTGGEALIEFGDGMSAAVVAIFKQAGFAGAEFFRDLAGRERLVHLFSPGGDHE